MFAQQADDLGACVRALHGNHRQLRPLDHFHAIGGGLLVDPGQVLLARGGVDHQTEEGFIEEINDQVVDHPTVGVQHRRVQRLARRLELVDRIGEQVAQELARARAAQVDHGHVADVEHAGVGAHGVVLLDLRAIVEGHVPAAEVHHPGAQGAVAVVEDGLLGHGRVLAKRPALFQMGHAAAAWPPTRSDQTSCTRRVMPSVATIRTAAPAGRSGPSTLQ